MVGTLKNSWPRPKIKMTLSDSWASVIAFIKISTHGPRSSKKAADEVLSELGIDDPVLDIAKRLEKEALEDPYFVDRKLYANVVFYSGIIYRAMGIPTEKFTVMIAIGRLPGWIAQWKEMRFNKEPIGRPRQVYTGHPHRKI